MENQTKKIEELFRRGILASEEVLQKNINEKTLDQLEWENDLLVLNLDYTDVLAQQTTLVDWYELDQLRVAVEKDRDDEELYQNHLQSFKKSTLTLNTPGAEKEKNISSLETVLEVETEAASFTTESDFSLITAPPSDLEKNGVFTSPASVKIVISFENKPKKYEVIDFTKFFISRYRFLEGLLRQRRELPSIAAINRLLGKKERETISIIGLIEEITETKNGNIIITMEDLTGRIKVLISKSKKDLFSAARDFISDEVIGISGTISDNIIFAESIVWPDVPQTHELKKGENEEYVLFLSDIHVGSALFLQEEFERFIHWINGQAGSHSQRHIAQKIRYIFIAGDLVDGVGVYPSQETELKIKDIKEQYAEFSRLLQLIPSHIEIIICPGNHDVVHLAEPQPLFYQQFAPDLFNIPNVQIVTNPSIVNIGKTATFSGFDVLMYHGFSFDYYVANVESIRTGGGYHRADLIMKFLLKRRHLAPAFKSTPYCPSHDEDPLLIKAIPDFFITGHIHYCSVANYRGITMISGSCWQGKTTFQEKLGHEPEPARVPLVNLKTREIKILRFG